MEKLNKKLECVKCGFRPTLQVTWKLSFADNCSNFGYSKCKWDDSETKEHLHQECPDCGYTIPVPCLDAEAVTANTWNTSATTEQPQTRGNMGTMKPEAHSLSVVNKTKQPVTPITQPTTTVYTPPKPAKCGKCPVDAKETAEA
jgi:hypothetical protein